ncbi:hypothetical protein L1987_64014 [Smallanthus sonchifolius]|uniref:Uncharacterized protein n=1 Tax=Smallanthus sonchifolius TaxID=185202 RepID=A0ACB9CEX0_9ASTR|nr:hypothetical protein L1987_64014 [Smallanthus sonchifolius]
MSAGMEFDNFEVDGRMAQHTKHNAQSKPVNHTFTTSPLLERQERFGTTPMFHGSRATLYDPIVILPRRNTSYPFVKPYKELPIVFGEWWNTDTEAIINQALQTGAGPNKSDAYTINETFQLKVKPGKTYLLGLINAALNDELFFKITNHTFTVVDVEASYVKPFETDTIFITPGQTSNVLLKTKNFTSNAKFFMAARPYSTAAVGTFDNTTVAGILQYNNNNMPFSNASISGLALPPLPAINASSYVANWTNKFHNLGTGNVPQAPMAPSLQPPLTTSPSPCLQPHFFKLAISGNPTACSRLIS